ncbi:MAG: hypothetical protein EA391_00605, partial [Balneolaceae bacterium]
SSYASGFGHERDARASKDLARINILAKSFSYCKYRNHPQKTAPKERRQYHHAERDAEKLLNAVSPQRGRQSSPGNSNVSGFGHERDARASKDLAARIWQGMKLTLPFENLKNIKPSLHRLLMGSYFVRKSQQIEKKG